MVLVLQREPSPDGIAVPGTLAINGLFFGYTLERAAVIIAAGLYPIGLQISPEVVNGGPLWAPSFAKGSLPTVFNVPGRSGLHIHALNEPTESEGCPGIAYGRSPDHRRLVTSRPALEALILRFLTADQKPSTIQFVEATAETPSVPSSDATSSPTTPPQT